MHLKQNITKNNGYLYFFIMMDIVTWAQKALLSNFRIRSTAEKSKWYCREEGRSKHSPSRSWTGSKTNTLLYIQQCTYRMYV